MALHGNCERGLRRALRTLAEKKGAPDNHHEGRPQERRTYRELLANAGLAPREIAQSRRRLEEALRDGGR